MRLLLVLPLLGACEFFYKNPTTDDADGDGVANAAEWCGCEDPLTSADPVSCEDPAPPEDWLLVCPEMDCDDTDLDIHPGAGERCNDKDDDCDGLVDEDLMNCGDTGSPTARRWFNRRLAIVSAIV